jgi:hypothetical protein
MPEIFSLENQITVLTMIHLFIANKSMFKEYLTKQDHRMQVYSRVAFKKWYSIILKNACYKESHQHFTDHK